MNYDIKCPCLFQKVPHLPIERSLDEDLMSLKLPPKQCAFHSGRQESVGYPKRHEFHSRGLSPQDLTLIPGSSPSRLRFPSSTGLVPCD